MSKQADHGLTATHVYGTAGLIAGALGLLLSIKGTSGVYQWLLFASGWLVAAFLTWFLVRTSGRLTGIIDRHDAETAAAATRTTQLEERVADLQREIDRRHATLDYLSSLLMTGTAMPRRPAADNDKFQGEAE